MSSKSTKSGLSEKTPSKVSPATPRVAKVSRGVVKSEPDSPSPLQNHRSSVDRTPKSVTSKSVADSPKLVTSKLVADSPKLVTSKPVADFPKLVSSKPVADSPKLVTSKSVANRQSPKTTTPPERPRTTSVVKSSELQAQLTAVQEDLKKAKEKITLIEKERTQAIDELKEAQRLSEEANGELNEALVAQKRAHEDSEIEKFRAVELEQAGIVAAQKKEEEWQREIEAVKNQHTSDIAALLSATQELEKAKQELAMIFDAKNQALSHADDATKIAEVHAEKVEILSAELTKLKAMLDSRGQTETNEYDEIVIDLKSEINDLKQELEREKDYEQKFVERETSIEQLNVELEAARMAESYNRSLVEEWQMKVEKLEKQVAKANKLERSASVSLESVMKQLEENNDMLHNAESEIDRLNEKVGLLEMTIKRQKVDLEESDHYRNSANEEAYEMAKTIESLKAELETVKEEKTQALNYEKLAALSVQNLLEEKNKLINELDISKEEEEKSKKAMESLASALHEVSVEAREAKEKLLSFQTEHESYKNEVEDLKMVLKATNEKYENILDESKHEIDTLTESLKQCKVELMNTEQKELDLVNCVRETEEENGKLRNKVANLMKRADDEASAAKEKDVKLKESLKEAEAEVIYLKEILGEAKAESMRLKESILDKETEMQSIFQESEELRAKEAAALQNRDELSKLLEEATSKKQTEANGELTESEMEYDLLPRVVEFSEQNGHANAVEEKTKEQSEERKSKENGVSNDEAVDIAKTEIPNGKPKYDEDTKEKEDDSVEIEYKMWESCKIEKKEFSPERSEVEQDLEASENLDEATNGLSSTEHNDDGGNSPTKQEPKKKKPLLRKFGSLLKSRKGSSNNK